MVFEHIRPTDAIPTFSAFWGCPVTLPAKPDARTLEPSVGSEEEIEVKLPKQKKSSAETAEDELYRRTYQRMFEI